MKYLPEPISRGDYGDYQHSELPSFGETLDENELVWWQDECNFDLLIYPMEGNVLEDDPAYREYYENGGSFSLWQPDPPFDDCVLLSIHATEDGPVAWWAKPRDNDNTSEAVETTGGI